MKKYLFFAFGLSLFVFCIFFFFLKSASCKHRSLDIVQTLEKLPKGDREALEWFFFYLNDSTAVYVLFGDKPMAICEYREIRPTPRPSEICQIDDLIDSFFESVKECNLRMRKGLEAWKKYEHLFPSSNFILLENRDPSDNWVTITIINKRAFLKKIEETIEDFKEALSTNITPQKILEECLAGNAIFEDVLNHHDGLLGILLGYGRHNAQLLYRRVQIDGIREHQKFRLTKTVLHPSEGFSTLEDEYNFISKKLSFFVNGEIPDFNPLLMSLPGFMADHDSPETQQLKTAYQEQYKKIISKYKQGDYLEVTLNQFCNES